MVLVEVVVMFNGVWCELCYEVVDYLLIFFFIVAMVVLLGVEGLVGSGYCVCCYEVCFMFCGYLEDVS